MTSAKYSRLVIGVRLRALSMETYLRATSQQDGPSDLLQTDASSVKAGCDLLVGRREAGLNASRGQEQAAHFLDELHFRVGCAPGSGLFLVRPEAVVDFERQL